MAGAGGEEDPQPLHVVDGAGQGGYLPLLGAVRAGVDVAQVHRPPQRPHPLAQLFPGLGDGPAVRCALGHHQGLTAQGRRLEAGPETEPARCHLAAPAAQDAPALVQAGPCAAHLDSTRGAGSRRRLGLCPQGTWLAHDVAGEAGTVAVRAVRVARGHDAFPQAPGQPRHQPATPAKDTPKLASMKAKSVKMSSGNAVAKRARLWNDAERAWAWRTRPWTASTR